MTDNWTANQIKTQEWLALPRYERIPPTQELFAESIGINSSTITRWKKQDGWQGAVNAMARNAVGGHLPEVYGSLVREAEKGSIQHIRTVLELTGELTQIGTEGNEVRVIVRVAWDDPTDNFD